MLLVSDLKDFRTQMLIWFSDYSGWSDRRYHLSHTSLVFKVQVKE